MQAIDMQEIERQHQQLIAMFHDLSAAVERWEPRETLYRKIDEVIASTRAHFEAEEQLMQMCAFPGLEEHREMHRQLVLDALHLKGKLEYVGEEMFTEWFDHWPFSRVMAHIQYADKQLEEHISRFPVRQ
ncbi:MAG: hemerythrin family protein [Gallionella sp.]|nr:hemerythrin family protein [Gallionella sp.]